MSFAITRERNKFGECMKMENSSAEVLIALDYGPRIVSYKRIQGENLLCEDPDGLLKNDDARIGAYYGADKVWYSRGGHRFWVAPEILPRTYYPDNAPIRIEIFKNSLTLIQEPQIKNGVQLIMEVSLEKDSSNVTVRHILRNTGSDMQRIAPWAITVMAAGGMEIIPRPRRQEEFLPTMCLAIWPYSDLKDERFHIHEKYICLRQMEKSSITGARKKKFKFGLNNEEGWAVYLNKGQMFKKEFIHNPQGEYPDMGVSFESYTDDKIMELETMGELKELLPGQETAHVERWSIGDIPEEFEEIRSACHAI